MESGLPSTIHTPTGLQKASPLHTRLINPPRCLRAAQFHTLSQTSLASSQQTHTLWSPDVKPWRASESPDAF